jgi:hypothetical protein
MDSQAQKAAHSLLTPRETLEIELVLGKRLTNIDTLPHFIRIKSTKESPAESEQIEQIPTALKEPKIEAFKNHVSKVNSDGLDIRNKEPFKVFAHLDYKIKLIAAKGASFKNVIKKKHICKLAAFYFKYIY